MISLIERLTDQHQETKRLIGQRPRLMIVAHGQLLTSSTGWPAATSNRGTSRKQGE